MKNLELCIYGVQELCKKELKNESGGWVQFIGGAIVGGVIYDAYKYAVKKP